MQEFLPETGEISRALALHCLETRPGNLICLYHAEKDKNGRIYDGADDGKYNVTGTPYPRNVRGPDDADVPVRVEGHLHCGCPEDEVLLAFLWWKTLEVQSPFNKITEGFRDQHLDPRTRTFMYEMWSQTTFQNVDTLYRDGMSRQLTKIRVLEDRLQGIREALDIEKKTQSALRNTLLAKK